MRRVSIARVMGVIGLVALGAAAVRNASDLWAGLTLGVTLLLFGTSTLR